MQDELDLARIEAAALEESAAPGAQGLSSQLRASGIFANVVFLVAQFRIN